MEGVTFSKEELSVIKTVFDSCDGDRVGRIHINQLSGMLNKLGKTDEDILNITESASRVADDNEGCLRFNDIVMILQQFDKSQDMPFEGSDPKVLEFLRILEDYRVKCEEEGNYLEAGRAFRQLGVLRKQEEKRQQKAIQARQISEKQDVQLAHNMQFSEFNKSWDRYMEEYDNMAQMYIQQMTERHAIVLLEFQKQLRQDLAGKPPKWSKDLLDQRRKQHINARNKNYTEAQKLKKQSDRHEERERKEMEQSQAIIFQRREAKYRLQQQTELQALLKRIECRRKEHLKQRGLDTKRLLQRNRNVQAVLDTKQAAESQRLFTDIKKMLFSNALLNNLVLPTGAQKSTSLGGKKSASSKLLHKYDSNDNNQYGAYDGGSNNYEGGGDCNQDQNQHGFYGDGGSPSDNPRGGGGEEDEYGQGGYQGMNVDPEFLKENGPNFNNLVYTGEGGGGNGAYLDGGSSYEEEDN